ncbi:hypothetical protein [Streptomyces sp. Ag109_O5-10]|uniref:hypothetical protein n=1 Tax=Streptomyces sp. Ag109_O5-10 TaxID=1855349 RepID=UPI0008990F43|nr:hypothetical protein [Streptomyces sp. Ag109_O5-10]SEE97622.1 hypothetical protein SAMN05216533_4829 [Streptomyces sp. Ag109_O5-10]
MSDDNSTDNIHATGTEDGTTVTTDNIHATSEPLAAGNPFKADEEAAAEAAGTGTVHTDNIHATGETA